MMLTNVQVKSLGWGIVWGKSLWWRTFGRNHNKSRGFIARPELIELSTGDMIYCSPEGLLLTKLINKSSDFQKKSSYHLFLTKLINKSSDFQKHFPLITLSYGHLIIFRPVCSHYHQYLCRMMMIVTKPSLSQVILVIIIINWQMGMQEWWMMGVVKDEIYEWK